MIPSNQDIELKRFTIDNLVMLLRYIIMFVFAMGISILLARGLGNEGKGTYEIIFLLPTLYATFFNFGLSLSITYHVSNSPTERESLVAAHLFLLVVLGCSGLLFGWLSLTVLKLDVFEAISPQFLFMGMLSLPLNLSTFNIRGIVTGMQDFRGVGLIDITQPVTTCILLILLFLTDNLTLLSAMFALIAGQSLAFVVALNIVRRKSGGWHDLIPSYQPAIWRKLFSYGLKVYSNSTVIMLLLRFDVLLLGWIGGGVGSVGIYSIAVGLTERIWSLTGITNMVLVSRVASWNQDDRRSDRLTALTFKYILWFSTVLALTLLVVGRWLIIFLFGLEFERAYFALAILAPGILMFGLGRLLASDTIGRGAAQEIVPYAWSAAILNIVLNLLLIPHYDIVGAALASSIAYTLYAFALMRRFLQKAHIHWTSLILPDKDDAQLIAQLLALLSRAIARK
jgi:O-antigen/teichoic acid export membrane protein